MPYILRQRTPGAEHLRTLLCAVLAVWSCACAATPPPDATGPRPSAARYPVILTEDEDRRIAALAEWTALTRDQGISSAPAPELQPVTATIRNIPLLPGSPLYLPKVGEATPMTEEETRESLRRFIVSERRLVGADPQQLSLVLRTDLADGSKKAQYQQRPFRYPLRGGYGQLEISFTPDRRILQVSSTCIPEIEQLQRAGAGIRPTLKAEQVAERIIGQTLTYTDSAGNQQTFTVTKGDSVTVRELVIYPRLRVGDPPSLEFHLAWEIMVGRAPERTVYVDAITNEVIAAL
jgi:hypothetical protein